MKKICLALLLFNCNLFSQEFSAIYGMKCTLDDTGNKATSEKINKALLSVVSTDDNEIEFNLIFKKNIALFSLVNTLKKNDNAINLSQIKAENVGLFYINVLTGIILNQKTVYDKPFIVIDSIKNIKWKLTNDTKTISNYKCYKAICTSFVYLRSETGTIKKERQITAWYAPAIPYSVGPIGYCILPGLILELCDDIFVYYLKKIDFVKNLKLELAAPKDGELVNKERFNKIYEDLYKDWEDEHRPKQRK